MADDEKADPAPHLAAYRFGPGTSGNPGGKPKGYGRRLREVVDGETVEHKKYGTISAWDAVVLKAVEDALGPNPVARHHARTFLADRLMGKPQQHVKFEDITPDDAPKVKDLTDEQLEILAAIGLGADEPKIH